MHDARACCVGSTYGCSALVQRRAPPLTFPPDHWTIDRCLKAAGTGLNNHGSMRSILTRVGISCKPDQDEGRDLTNYTSRAKRFEATRPPRPVKFLHEIFQNPPGQCGGIRKRLHD